MGDDAKTLIVAVHIHAIHLVRTYRINSWQTQYFVKAQHGTMSDAMIELLAKQKGFLDYERRLLDGEAATYLQVDKNSIIVNVPAVDPEVTTEFVTKFLEWMDADFNLAGASHRPQQAADGWEKVFAFYERHLG